MHNFYSTIITMLVLKEMFALFAYKKPQLPAIREHVMWLMQTYCQFHHQKTAAISALLARLPLFAKLKYIFVYTRPQSNKTSLSD